MVIIRNNIIPFKGYKAMNILGILFCRKNARIDEVTITHECIHTAQMCEMLFVFFYLWYCIEYIVKLIIYRNTKKAYRSIGFEREAYVNEIDPNYLKNRKHYSWISFINV